MRRSVLGGLVVLVLTVPSAVMAGAVRGVTSWTFDPGPGADTEVSLATDPRKPGRALVAWQEDITRVWSAFTRNGGRTWDVRLLHDPVAAPTGTTQEAFDPTAAIGPDGTLYVLMGGLARPAAGLALTGGITLARSTDGTRWSYHHVDDVGTAHVWDAMHLAVAPDTGHLYVVAQSIDHRGIGFWRSSDRGRTWGVVRFPQIENPVGAAQVAQDGFEFWPRIAAGRGGLVLLVTKAALGTVKTTVSRDGGATFGAVTPLTGAAVSGRLVGVPAAFDGTLGVIGYVTERGVVLLRSQRAGPGWAATWSTPDEQGEPDWSTVVARRGVVWVLHTEQSSGPEWRVVLTKSVGRSMSTKVLARVDGGRPRGDGAGDEYGGLAVAADGSVWAAWSQPREGQPVIRVMRRAA